MGKTTFAQGLIKNFVDGHPAYLNWDLLNHREQILKGSWPRSQKLIIMDELHKYSKWRGLIKGYFDSLKNTHQFLVTGSARLDHYRKGGGFPEPFLKHDQVFLKRWHKQRRERIVYSDIRDLENVKEISNLEILMNALPTRVGSPLSKKSKKFTFGIGVSWMIQGRNGRISLQVNCSSIVTIMKIFSVKPWSFDFCSRM